MPAKEKRAPTIPERLAAIEKQAESLASEFDRLVRDNRAGEDVTRLELALNHASTALQEIRMIHSLYR